MSASVGSWRPMAVWEGKGLASNPLYSLSHCNHWIGRELESHSVRVGLEANQTFRIRAFKNLPSKFHSAYFVRQRVTAQTFLMVRV